MTPITRILELFATSDRVHLELTKFGPKSFFLRLNDLDDTNATAVGESLEQVARGGELAAIHQGLITEPCPRTEPGCRHPHPDLQTGTCPDCGKTEKEMSYGRR